MQALASHSETVMLAVVAIDQEQETPPDDWISVAGERRNESAMAARPMMQIRIPDRTCRRLHPRTIPAPRRRPRSDWRASSRNTSREEYAGCAGLETRRDRVLGPLGSALALIVGGRNIDVDTGPDLGRFPARPCRARFVSRDT